MKKKNLWYKLISCALVVAMATSFMMGVLLNGSEEALALSGIRRYEGDLETNWEKYLNDSVAYKLPDTVKDSDDLSLIIQVKEAPLLDAYRESDSDLSFTEYAYSEEALAITRKIIKFEESTIERLKSFL